ncbi:hypothetical protein D9V34_01475 [Mycetocola lacteus]|uniref:Uncharacterized protein n=1 Tax=Mycetocola lacteus TaxID=76637 RepID=A0A3L7AMR7_9MICO|nr:hypothetical protein [Mycetocola lacteus]RLP80911.1 hypothetical protein D9V34_13770 [Mycetocola lacteus]RLP84696.1 hypothetical protein D9V34_01475 [Mycetocola lacteus]
MSDIDEQQPELQTPAREPYWADHDTAKDFSDAIERQVAAGMRAIALDILHLRWRGLRRRHGIHPSQLR